MHRLGAAPRPGLILILATTLVALALDGAHAAPADGVAQATGPASPGTDSPAELRDVAERYARAWYEGNAGAMAGTLHPEFIHHTLRHTARRPDTIESASGLSLLDRTDRGFGRNTAPSARHSELRDLQVAAGTASARLQLADRAEHLQFVRWNNQWRILHALVELDEAGAP